jgi:hypothetical protein
MGLFSAHIWHNTPFLYAFSPSEWEKKFDAFDRAKKVVFCDYVT